MDTVMRVHSWLLSTVVTAVPGSVLGALSAAAATVRGGRPLHPDGVVFDAVVRRTGSRRRWGAPWLDDPGEDRGLARLSRAAGLPAWSPDVLGLAVSFDDPDGERHDLLLSSTGTGRVSRFVLRPRRDFATAYTCLLPYLGTTGLVVLGAVPDQARSAGPVGFRLLAAAPRGPWHEFGQLHLTARDSEAEERRFDPVLHPLPELRLPPALASLREPAYAAARRFGRLPGSPLRRPAEPATTALPRIG